MSDGTVDEKVIRRLRIQHVLATFRREGANARALAKERARLEALSSADLAALQVTINGESTKAEADVPRSGRSGS